MKKIYWFLILLGSLLAAACQPSASQEPLTTSEPSTLTVMTHDSFAASEAVIKVFETENNARVVFLGSGDTGTALNKAILAKGNPLADVFYGVDNTFLTRALQEDIFEPYTSPLLDQIPPAYKLDAENRALPVDFGDVCLNYDRAFFETNQLRPPANLEDLLKQEYRGLVVVENPATSSPGLAFLLTTIAKFGEEGYLDFWQSLVNNDLLVVNDWETAYYTEFSRSGGSRPIVLSYASSPAAEVIFSDQPLDESPTAAITASESCFRQIEFVGILKGTPNRDLAEKWIDFMLSPAFQEDVPLQMFVMPVNQNAQVDETFQKYTVLPEATASINPQTIAENREEWIRQWTETVLR
jgi:thiamine transport system substrate-binding protein